MRAVILTILIGFGCNCSHAQDIKGIGELRKRMSGYQADEDRMRSSLRVSDLYIGFKPDSAEYFARQAMRMAERLEHDSVHCHARYQLARSFDDRGMFDSSLVQYRFALKEFEQTEDSVYVISSCAALGNTYYYLGNHKAAIRMHNEALLHAVQWGESESEANAHNNLGIVLSEQKFYTEAMGHYRKALAFFNKTTKAYSIGSTMLNIWNIFAATHVPDSAVWYFLKADSLFEIEGNPYARALNQSNMGEAYYELGLLDSSRAQFDRAMAVQKEIADDFGLGYSLASLARVEMKEGHVDRAETMLLRADSIGIRTGALRIREMAHNGLQDLYRLKGDFGKALEYHTTYIAFRDSMLNIDTRKAITSLEAEAEDQRKEAEIERNALIIRKRELQLIVSLGAMVLLALMIFLIGYFVHRLRSTNQRLANQSALLSQANLDVTDSIHSAERLQRAALPDLSAEVLDPGTFSILFKPRNIVSGDFYWGQRLSRDRFLIAVADATGHGVPGALLSMVCSISLDRCVKEHGLVMPDLVLRKTHQLLRSVFNQFNVDDPQRTGAVRDGMDISICLIDRERMLLHYAGARGNGFVKRNDGTPPLELRGDRFSIGDGPEPGMISTQSFKLMADDVVVLYSDGIIDQFGGGTDRKFGLRRLRDWLVCYSGPDVGQMALSLEKTLDEWIGETEQTDDMTMVAFKV